MWELAYTKPTITNTNVTRSEDGTTIQVAFDWATTYDVASVEVLLTSSADTQTIDISASGKSGSGDTSFTQLNPELVYTIRITVTDSGGEWAYAKTLPGMLLAMDFMPNNKGASVGKAAEIEGAFDIAFKTKLSGGLLYPVLETGTDLNDLLTPNMYSGNNASTNTYGNCPITSGTFTLEVLSAGPDGQIYQRLTRCEKNVPAVYERFYYTKAWGAWSGGWIYPTLTSDFTMYGSSESANRPKYRKDGRLVEVRGIVTPLVQLPKSGDNSTAIYTIFTLPAGYRPNSPIYTICQGSGNCTWLLRVETDGGVGFSRYRNGDTSANVTPGTDGGSGTWLPFQVTFFSN